MTGLALSAPLAWLLAAVLLNGSTSDALDRPVFAWVAVVIVVVSVPLTLRLLFELFYPELTTPAHRRQKAGVVVLVAVVALVGFLAGHGNDRLMTCSDFVVAGAHAPDNCRPD
ncbi:MAG: hypothetical protein SW019_13415 [Actinomycetota bacterium]|nr:hypothetical protein [Actinomycetota bacterium]